MTSGSFDTHDMAIMIPELKKLKKGDIYLEIGVDKGKSFAVAWFTTEEEVECYGVDNNDTSERQKMFEKEKMKTFIHTLSIEAAQEWDSDKKINLLFIDGAHDYESVKEDINAWYPHMAEQGVILFHDHTAGSAVMRAACEWAADKILYEYSFPVQTENGLSPSSIAKIVL